MLSLPAPSHIAPPPRPRPSTAPQASRLPPQIGEHGTRERRRRARSNSRPRQRSARSPRRRRRSRTPTVGRQEQAGPSLPPGNWHPAPDPQFPPPRPVSPHVFQPMQPPGHHPSLPLGKLMPKLRLAGFQQIRNGQLHLFHYLHNRSSLTGHQKHGQILGALKCRATKPPGQTGANLLCH